jgi:flagellin
LDAIKIEVEQRMEEINRLCRVTDFNDTYLLDGSRTEDINLQVGLYSDKNCVIVMDKFLFESAEATTIFGFTSKAKEGGFIDLRTSATKSDVFCYQARKLNPDGSPKLKPDGSVEYVENQYYSSALAAALAENGDITFATNSATINSTAGNGNFTIAEMCSAIYRNDSSAREFINNIDKAIDNVSLRVTEIGAYMNRLESTIESTDVQRESLTQSISTLKDADVATESSNYIKYQILQQSAATLLATANQQPQIALNLL